MIVTNAGGLQLVADVFPPSASAKRTPVMLVHGLGFARRHWRRQVAALGEVGFTCVTLDLRGFGDSALPNEPYTMRELARDLDSVRAWAGFDRVHLVGHSMGGMVALHYALDAPERVASLVLASTTGHNGRRAGAFARAMAMLSDEGFERAMADPKRRAEVEAILAEAVPYVGQVLGILRQLTLEADRGRALAWQAIAGFSVRSELARIHCPTLVLHGSADQNIPFAAGQLLHEAIAGSEWVPLEDAPHVLPQARLNAELVRFLSRVD
ncbi:MAG TPA: alpha/beta hydrolase [Polyangiaceae bacterium]|nr:alpha/beta hydrolase [Polyangiaceae bacterium]